MVEVKNKKRKVSKKTKKSWRKYVDTTDVDKFLENERLEERLGVPFSKRTDTDLFTIDKKGAASEEVASNDKKQRRLALKNKEPKCFEALKPHTLVPDPITKRNRVRTPDERKHPIIRRKEIERKSKGILKLKEKLALKDKALADLKRVNKPKRGDFKDDIWEKENASLPQIDTEWMTSDTVRHIYSHMGLKKRKIPTSLHKKPSVLPAIEVPHPGTSYNPSYDDHQNLLREVAQKELELMKEEAHLNRVTTHMFKKVSTDEKEKNILQEMSEGLPIKKSQTEASKSKNNDTDDDDNDDDNDDDDADMNPNITSLARPVKNKKKTLVERRKQKERKILAHKVALAKLEKKKVSDIYKLKLLNKQIAAKEKKENMLRERRLKQQKLKSVAPKTLSKIKFEPIEPVFTLAEELSGNLRNVSRTGNLLKDRYKSLQQRNILAPANLVLKRTKTKVKKYIKADHKITQS